MWCLVAHDMRTVAPEKLCEAARLTPFGHGDESSPVISTARFNPRRFGNTLLQKSRPGEIGGRAQKHPPLFVIPGSR